MKNFLPFLLFGGIALLIFKSAKNLVTNLSFSILDASIDKKNTSLNSISAKIVLGIQNDSNNSTTIKRIYLQYYLKDKIIGRTDANGEININPLALNKITLPLNIPTFQFLASLGTTLSDFFIDQINPTITIKGKIFVTGGAIDINENIPFKIK